MSGPQTEKLEPRTTLNGKFDAYCHVCWEPIYVLWVDDSDPAGKCPWRCIKATDCTEAMTRIKSRERIRRFIDQCDREFGKKSEQ